LVPVMTFGRPVPRSSGALHHLAFVRLDHRKEHARLDAVIRGRHRGHAAGGRRAIR
jgi:hypothetical protein